TAYINPARGAHCGMPHELYGKQQPHHRQVSQGHPARHEARLELGNHQHHAYADAKGRSLLDQQIPNLAAGRIKDEQTAGCQYQQQGHQQPVDMQPLQQTGATPQHVLAGQGPIEAPSHGCTSATFEGGAYSAFSCPCSSSNQASSTCLATGAATPEPDSPFSTITATAICGLSTGAKATNNAWS